MRTTLYAILLVAAPALAPYPARAEDDGPQETASGSGKSDPQCMAPLAAPPDAATEKLTIGARELTITGPTLSVASARDDDAQVNVGVIAAVNEASPENLFNLGRYLDFFASKKVELIVVAGDSGKEEDVVAILRKLGGSGLPVLVYAGNQEHRPEFVKAVDTVRAELPNVISGHRVRRLEWDDVTIFTLPGHFDRRFLHRGRSCVYYKEDLDALAEAIPGAPGPVLLAAHSSPLGKKRTAIDVVAGAENVGDSNLSALITSAKIPFGIFPNIKESGGKATTDVAGARVLKPGTASATLYLNPGAADSQPWGMNDGSTSRGSVAVLSIRGGKASYEILRAPKITDADRATFTTR